MTEESDFRAIFNELLFQKSLLVEDAKKYTQLDRYMEIAKSLPEADHHAIKDPFDRSIAIAFELVISNNMDPRAIDIVNFSRLYLQRVREENAVNFVVSGRIIFMAWSVLRLESDMMLSRIVREKGESADVNPNFFYIFDDDPVNFDGEFELQPAIRSNFTRDVSIMDLLDAFTEAQKEIEEHLKRASSAGPAPGKKFSDNAHREDPEKEINFVLEKLFSLGPGPVAFSDMASTREEVVTVFLSMLFLARLGKIRIWQEDEGGREIYLEATGQQQYVTVEFSGEAQQEPDL
jgi:segregation and condensation protein A